MAIFMSQNLREGGTYWYWCISVVVGVGFWVRIGMTLSCLHNILWTSGWTLTKLSWICNWDITKNSFDFGNLDLIFGVKAVEKLKIYSWETSVFSENAITSSVYVIYTFCLDTTQLLK